MEIRELAEDIKRKKELRNLDPEFIIEKIEDFLESNHRIRERFESKGLFRKSRECKELIKKVRAQLREIYGVFILKDYHKIEKYIAELKTGNKEGIIKKILQAHQSTKERLPYYPQVYKRIFSVTGRPERILDLGCGLNPVAYPYLGCRPFYIASDLSEKDCALLNEFFIVMKIKAIAFPYNLLHFKKTSYLEHLNADVCFLFKVIDPVESQSRDFTEYLVKNLPCKHLVVSFSTKSIGGRKSIRPEKRAWFEKILKNFSYKSFEIPNEKFYIIRRVITE